MTTLRSISEQISRLYSRNIDKENPNQTLDWREVKRLVIQKANWIISAVTFNKTSDGYRRYKFPIEIPSCIIGSYTVAVQNDGALYYSTLPVQPISLPHDMGVWRILPLGVFKGDFIPIPSSFWSLIGDLAEGDLENQVGYSVDGNKVYYTKNPAETSVTIKLLVADIEKISDTDPLPIGAEMEDDIIKEVLKHFLPTKEIDIEPKPEVNEDSNNR